MNSSSPGAAAPVSVVVIGVERLETSLAFYEGVLGLEVREAGTLDGPDFTGYWHLPAGASARVAFLGHGPDPVGRIQLMEFSGGPRQRVWPPGLRRATGLFNINLYTSDLRRDHAGLSARGFEFWGEPARTDFGPAVGATLESAFDGPDGVAINLVELLTDDPQTLVGHISGFVRGYGRTRTGFTPVVTTAHSVSDMDKALAFYYGPLHMKLFVESVLEGEETNQALNLPAESRTRSVLVQGDHEFGKIALAQPINYAVPSVVERAVAPNIGYLAQAFQVADLDAAQRGAAEVGAAPYAGPVEMDLPGRGRCRAMLVRNPGSGALQELFQPL